MQKTNTFKVPDSLAVSDSGFLFLASTGETFTLNAIGKEIFTMLKEGTSTEQIRENLLAEYDVDAKTLERDVDDFFGHLTHLKLLVAQ